MSQMHPYSQGQPGPGQGWPTTQGYHYPGPVVPATDQRTDTAHIVIAWVFTVFTFGYMLPWAIAATRGKSNAVPVALVSFFTGWTLIGWVAALVMACGPHQAMGGHSVNVVVAQQFGPYPYPLAPGHYPAPVQGSGHPAPAPWTPNAEWQPPQQQG